MSVGTQRRGGQEPRIVTELRAHFNAASGAIRVITFLSPTCSFCRYGQGIVNALFEAFPGDDLHGFLIWVPMLPTDTAGTAQSEQDLITDPRINCWYDADRAASGAWSSFIHLPSPTWDVYAVYDPAATWRADEPPPAPRVWMHQLPPSPATLEDDRLDPGRLAAAWLALLGRPSEQAPALTARLITAAEACAHRPDSAAPTLGA